ncbi:hypothetical protein HDU91_003525, partial [Kappamyces sp. JEL0680]
MSHASITRDSIKKALSMEQLSTATRGVYAVVPNAPRTNRWSANSFGSTAPLRGHRRSAHWQRYKFYYLSVLLALLVIVGGTVLVIKVALHPNADASPSTSQQGPGLVNTSSVAALSSTLYASSTSETSSSTSAPDQTTGQPTTQTTTQTTTETTTQTQVAQTTQPVQTTQFTQPVQTTVKTTQAPQPTNPPSSGLAGDCLSNFNSARSSYGAPGLAWSDSLASLAASSANYCATVSQTHTNLPSNGGQILFITMTSCSAAMNGWFYAEAASN